MGMSFFYLVLLAILQFNSGLASLHPQNIYSAQCLFYNNDNITHFEGNIALYSIQDISLRGTLVKVNSDLCLEPKKQKKIANMIAVVNRGNCSFETKSRNAELEGYLALIIVNTDTSLIPPGGTALGLLPTILISSSFWVYYAEQCTHSCPNIEVQLIYVTSPQHRVLDSPSNTSSYIHLPSIGYSLLLIISIAICLVGILGLNKTTNSQTTVTSQNHFHLFSSGGVFIVLTLFLILGLTTLLRLGTLRLKKIPIIQQLANPPLSEVVYNHREMDELIFETLVNSVSKSFYDYSLKNTDLIETYQLSRENYDDNLFIHPPLFVYSLYFLREWLHLPLPLSILVLHILTALSIFPLTITLLSSSSPSSPSSSSSHASITAIWAVLIFLFCPISSFCSQKIWIDNMSALTVTLSALVHLLLTRNAKDENENSSLHQFYSGLFFGLFSLNSKITCLALIPFLCLWTISQSLNGKGRSQLQQFIFLFKQIVFLLIGAVVGYAPWVIIYYNSTNRFLPNAWPSAHMISKSVYLQEVISRHPLTYFTRLFTINPIHIIGLLLGILIIFMVLYQLIGMIFTFNSNNNNNKTTLKISSTHLQIAIFTTWPIAFLLGLTLIGLLGGGYQIRFILPILPATSILTSICLTSGGMKSFPLFNLLFAYSSFHLLYYSILYSPLIADFDVTIFDILELILNSTLEVDSFTKDSLLPIYKFMKHFGLAMKM